MENNSIVKVIPLGGLGEIGKNITAIEYKDEIIIIDCGNAFPDEDMYGVDLVIPDITYLLNNKEKVKGIFLTHGHEDHIGALPYILKQLNVPLFGTELTLGLIKLKLEEHNILHDCELYAVKPGNVVKLKYMNVEFIRNTHSIPDSCSLAIHTPIGRIVHTGDFKVDYTPMDEKMMDLKRLAKLGNQGVLLLLADSTNVERPGYTLSERAIGDTFRKTFARAKGRVIIATFASNIHRMQQIVDASVERKRKIAFIGRSMEKVSKLAMDLGYLHVPEGYLVDVDEINRYPSEGLTIITTGSQGEPMSGLARMAASTHKLIRLEKGDLVIVSSSAIPGNEKFISRVINQLFKKGVEVVYDDIEDVHVSGHACREEIKLIHSLVRPKFFVPVHGEYKHLWHHALLAQELGMSAENTFIIETGDVFELSQDGCRVSGRVPSGAVMVDGIGVGDVGNIVLRDRRHLAEDGMFTIVVTIEKESYSIIAGPDIITRGFVYVKESENLINEAKEIIKDEIEKCLDNKITDWMVIKSNIKSASGKFLYEKTKRRPIVLPIIMEI